jgi:hypothetical protein
MKYSPKFLWALAVALTIGIGARGQEMDHARFQANPGSLGYTPSFLLSIPAPSGGSDLRGGTRFATRFEGDHSLDAAIVTEHIFAPHTFYTIRLRFASGIEQSIVLTAPPGGLQPEMRDMNGDNVPNDLVLTPVLVRLPLIVLVNEGHDHLTVAISPGEFLLSEERANGSRPFHHVPVFRSSGFKLAGFSNSRRLPLPQLQDHLCSLADRMLTNPSACAYSPGRAPPAPVTNI